MCLGICCFISESGWWYNLLVGCLEKRDGCWKVRVMVEGLGVDYRRGVTGLCCLSN